MEELKIEAATWELYEPEIKEAILGEKQPPQTREAVNALLAQIYERIEPILKAQRALSLAEGYREALNKYGLPQDDKKARAELEAERGWVDELIKGHRSRISGLMGQYQHELHRVAMLHEIRDKLPAPDKENLREPA